MREITQSNLQDMDRILASSNPARFRAVEAEQQRAQASACTGNCNQGRACTCRPAPAEAATDVGMDDDTPRAPLTAGEALFVCLIGLLSTFLMVGLAGYVWGRWFPPIN